MKKDLHEKRVKAGQLGGLATVHKYGSQYMQTIGRKGAHVTRSRYRLVPIGVNNFAMVDRRTGEVKATFLAGRQTTA